LSGKTDSGSLQAARLNLKNSPPIFVDVALEQIPGIISFSEGRS
jgi:hypothetical protein